MHLKQKVEFSELQGWILSLYIRKSHNTSRITLTVRHTVYTIVLVGANIGNDDIKTTADWERHNYLQNTSMTSRRKAFARDANDTLILLRYGYISLKHSCVLRRCIQMLVNINLIKLTDSYLVAKTQVDKSIAANQGKNTPRKTLVWKGKVRASSCNCVLLSGSYCYDLWHTDSVRIPWRVID